MQQTYGFPATAVKPESLRNHSKQTSALWASVAAMTQRYVASKLNGEYGVFLTLFGQQFGQETIEPYASLTTVVKGAYHLPVITQHGSTDVDPLSEDVVLAAVDGTKLILERVPKTLCSSGVIWNVWNGEIDEILVCVNKFLIDPPFR